MIKYLKPNFYFDHYEAITPQWLSENKIKFIISDLDSTLAPHNETECERFREWYESIESVGTGLIIISNNNETRVSKFVADHKIVGIWGCKKPSTKKIESELFCKGLVPETTLLLGDQLFTDIWCGKRLGVKTALVKPIKGQEPINIKLKRKIENLIIKNWKN